MKLEISRDAGRALRKSNKRELIARKIALLVEQPLSQQANVIRLQGRTAYRLRVQDWRVIFRIEGDTIIIDSIEPRGTAYEERS
ncbi:MULTISPECIES: type II toxin-antitoxin system RelE/ParE family toxin [unclassified Sphingomonas]|uniref:type II toxin-antitoxin system RelE family toxin n=1 Tax=unclassified Sphingomonas TaxID=196159 RepID=UPI000BCBE5AD|nr:MAG: addiction module toxin RelE [Sphingomonas sp. 12-62-6]OYX38331.1 MAG: addiction module toxin RelE [Sphingomonas sp. 32-62-10]